MPIKSHKKMDNRIKEADELAEYWTGTVLGSILEFKRTILLKAIEKEDDELAFGTLLPQLEKTLEEAYKTQGN